MFGAVAELARLIVLFFVFMFVGNLIIEPVYNILEVGESASFFVYTGLAVLFFVLYRNKFQWNGWYEGAEMAVLSKRMSRWLVTTAFAMLIAPPTLSVIM
ncbi:hypothetical protein JCM19037_2309 [Geomicrobium sp. JCM 19037]|uniref:hypothetical protein n=1 Tax=Geomicrobium sp. JCM 19037 TaxID=1460634 RepID=UPI00045F4B25|nr:hypothetical protein [Geomicrobium sp. JCM 19037]GAK03946.1 hypothetical protein JCM19037_2309 [Geomicrobium sp. JCM 19037]